VYKVEGERSKTSTQPAFGPGTYPPHPRDATTDTLLVLTCHPRLLRQRLGRLLVALHHQIVHHQPVHVLGRHHALPRLWNKKATRVMGMRAGPSSVGTKTGSVYTATQPSARTRRAHSSSIGAAQDADEASPPPRRLRLVLLLLLLLLLFCSIIASCSIIACRSASSSPADASSVMSMLWVVGG
jgi:hypothetical protein